MATYVEQIEDAFERIQAALLKMGDYPLDAALLISVQSLGKGLEEAFIVISRQIEEFATRD